MASSISEAQAELISSLSADDIPIKLRCAICSKLAVNAFRLPCCEQAICESCQSSLPQSCPVCEHSPLSAQDCNPNKSLRTTIKVFLRTAEKKRESSRHKEKKETESTKTVAEASAPTQESNGTTQSPDPSLRPEDEASVLSVAQAVGKPDPVTGFEGARQAGDSREVVVAAPEHAAVGGAGDVEPAEAEDVGGGHEDGLDQGNYAPNPMNGGYSQHMMYPASADYNPNPMQMMMAMQNGMASSPFGGFPMMGMGVDPMTMQSMYMNGGYQGMGMNGMNGMGGYGGGFGQGSNNTWNGSQSWNFGQNNYNQSGPGMGADDFGSFNPGYQTGYNQGAYGPFPDYRRNNFGRGRGRARVFQGAFGRGVQQHAGPAPVPDQGHVVHQLAAAYGQAQPDSGTGGDAGHESREAAADGGGPDKLGEGPGPEEGGDSEGHVKDGGQLASREVIAIEAVGDLSRVLDSPVQEPGAIRSVLSAPDVPINAPTGPKAMRQGLPNTSLHHLRARGYQLTDAASRAAGAATAPTPVTATASPGSDPRARSSSPAAEEKEETAEGRTGEEGRGLAATAAPKQASALTEAADRSGDGLPRSEPRNCEGAHDRSQGRNSVQAQAPALASAPTQAPTTTSAPGPAAPTQAQGSGRGRGRNRGRDRSRSRSPSGGRRSSQRRRRRRSASAGDEKHGEGRRRRRRRGSRKHREDGSRHGLKEQEERQAAERPRSASPEASRKWSQQRGHREKEEAAEGRRDQRDRGLDASKPANNHRSYRDRDRDRDHELGRRREKDRDRDRDRERDKERRERKEGHRTSDPLDRDARHGGGGGGGKTHKDAHTMEREARNRDRLLREAQRMAGLAGSKRGADELDDGGGGGGGSGGGGGGGGGRKASRRLSRRVASANDEERMRRLEAEREGGRWA